MHRVFSAFGLMAGAVGIAAMCSPAMASLTVSLTPVDNSSVSNLSGYTTQDITISTTTDWQYSELLLNLTSGSVYQEPNAGNVNPQSPNPVFFAAFPALKYDTYLSDGTLGDSVSIAGGATDLGGQIASTFTTSAIDTTWFTSDTDNIGNLDLARISLSNDANGSFSLRTVNSDFDPTVPLDQTGTITNGVMTFSSVPEPASLALLAMGGLLAVRRRRRSA